MTPGNVVRVHVVPVLMKEYQRNWKALNALVLAPVILDEKSQPDRQHQSDPKRVHHRDAVARRPAHR